MTVLTTQPYKGTRDYFPEEKRLQTYIFDTWRRVVQRYGYEEYGAPLLEPLELYAAKSGQELVSEQTYVFTDRGGRTVAIRPEMTPTVSRMVAARRQELAYPARLFSIANFMRYERPQRGREREFWQLNVDIFGSDTLTADAEILTIADAILKEFGAHPNDYTIRINSRGFIHSMMAEYLGLDSEHASQMIKLFDRRSKISDQDFNEQLSRIVGEGQEDTLQKVAVILNARNLEALPGELKQSGSFAELRELFTMLEDRNISSAVFDATLMRGLDYYTGTVFEVFDTHPDNNRSLFGGGRYDGLVGLFGAEPVSAVGMAPGNSTIENFLEVHNLIPTLGSKTDVYIVTIGDSRSGAEATAAHLRAGGLNVEVDGTHRKLDKQLRAAIKKGIPYVMFVGEKDLVEGSFSLKNLADESEERMLISEIIDTLTRR